MPLLVINSLNYRSLTMLWPTDQWCWLCSANGVKVGLRREKWGCKWWLKWHEVCRIWIVHLLHIYLFKIQFEGLFQPKSLHKNTTTPSFVEKKNIQWFFEGVWGQPASHPQVALLLRCAPFPFGPGTRRRPGPPETWGEVQTKGFAERKGWVGRWPSWNNAKVCDLASDKLIVCIY